MKKFLLSAAVAMMAAGMAGAQSARFVQDGAVIDNNANITIYDFNEVMGQMEWTPILYNTTDQAVQVVVQVSVTSNPDNSFLALCVYGQCYSPTVTETQVITIPAGSGIADFHTQFMPNSDTSKATAVYTMYNVNDETGEDMTTVTITYDYPSYIAGESLTQVQNKFSLKQNGNTLVCNYSFDKAAKRQVIVTSIVGAQVARIALNGNSGEQAINRRLGKGVYIYTLVENGRNVKSHKIIIR